MDTFTIVKKLRVPTSSHDSVVFVCKNTAGQGLSLTREKLCDLYSKGIIQVTNAKITRDRQVRITNTKHLPTFPIQRCLSAQAMLGLPAVHCGLHYGMPGDEIVCYGLDPNIKKMHTMKSVSVADGTVILHTEAFYYDKDLHKVTLPNTLIKIMPYAFAHSMITKVDIPNSVLDIGGFAFENNRVIKQIKLSDSLLRISTCCFRNCVSLESIVLPDTLRDMGNQVFNGCTNLKSVKLSNRLTTLPPLTFRQCTSLQQVSLPSSLKILSRGAFESCSSLETLTLPETLRLIENSAFYGCKSLAYLDMSSVRKCEGRIFTGCFNLKKLIMPKALCQGDFRDRLGIPYATEIITH